AGLCMVPAQDPERLATLLPTRTGHRYYFTNDVCDSSQQWPVRHESLRGSPDRRGCGGAKAPR
ncbi:MAG: hypothetical protein ACREA0_14520, partial [bacterium]